MQLLSDNKLNGNDINEIIPRLYLCGLASIHNIKEMESKTHIVQCIESHIPGKSFLFSPILYPPKSPYDHIIYHEVPLLDTLHFPIAKYFDSVADWIHEQLKDPSAKVVIHCQQGVSRSVSICMAYLIKYYGMSHFDSCNYECILKYIKKRHARALPNIGFQKQLLQYCEHIRTCHSTQDKSSNLQV